jgi:hypothetical protein
MLSYIAYSQSEVCLHPNSYFKMATSFEISTEILLSLPPAIQT